MLLTAKGDSPVVQVAGPGLWERKELRSCHSVTHGCDLHCTDHWGGTRGHRLVAKRRSWYKVAEDAYSLPDTGSGLGHVGMRAAPQLPLQRALCVCALLDCRRHEVLPQERGGL